MHDCSGLVTLEILKPELKAIILGSAMVILVFLDTTAKKKEKINPISQVPQTSPKHCAEIKHVSGGILPLKINVYVYLKVSTFNVALKRTSAGVWGENKPQT